MSAGQPRQSSDALSQSEQSKKGGRHSSVEEPSLSKASTRKETGLLSYFQLCSLWGTVKTVGNGNYMCTGSGKTSVWLQFIIALLPDYVFFIKDSNVGFYAKSYYLRISQKLVNSLETHVMLKKFSCT